MSQFFAHVAHQLSVAAKSKHLVRVIGVLVVVGLFIVLPIVANAEGSFFDPLYRIASGLLFWAANVLGKLTLLLFGILVQVAQYNDFINAEAVTLGWVILRDLANMLFILVLLVIAFGTAFRIQQYRYNTLLRQLIIMAVLINFSKLITGFFIDLVQVIMMTFVNAFADTAAGNLTTALGLDKVLMLNTAVPGDEITNLSVAGTLAIGVVMIAVMTVVTLLYVVIFLARIIFLWILIILSPLAYLFATFPSTRKYWTNWWQKFWQYAVIGPILAFFLWLTLTVTAAGNAALLLDATKSTTDPSTLDQGGQVTAAISAIGSQSGILSFLVAIMLLIFSLKTATEFGVAGGSWAANTFNKTRDTALLGARRLTGAVAGGLYGATAQRPAEWLANKATAGMALSRVPLVSGLGMRLNSRLGSAQQKRKEKHEALMKNVKSDAVIAMHANGIGWSADAKAQREIAQKMHPGSINNATRRAKVLTEMSDADFRGMKPSRLYEIVKSFGGGGAGGPHITDVYPEIARAIAHGGRIDQKRALGLEGVEWLRPRRATAAGAPATPGTFYSPTGAMPTPVKPLADINREKYDATREAIEARGGKAEEFYASPAYQLDRDRYLGQESFLEAQAIQRERERKVERGETRIDELTGVRSATRKGAQGQSANLAMDFAEGEMLGLALGGGAGANLTGSQQKIAAGVLSEKYKSQEEAKEAEKRLGDVQREELQSRYVDEANAKEAEQRYQAARLQDSLRGESHTEDETREQRDQILRDLENDPAIQDRLHGEAAQADLSSLAAALTPEDIARQREESLRRVQADTAFQQSLGQETEEFRTSLENAKSINLINKGRVGRSARKVLRHEQAHDAVSGMDEEELDTYWEQLAPERQQEIEAFVRSNWANGDKMNMREIQEEFFTEVFSSHARSNRLGPLDLNMEDPEKYQETRRVIDEEFGGKADAFYKSRKYRDNTADYVQRDNMQRAVAEEDLAERLSGAATLNRQEKARASVETLSPEGVRSLWMTMNPKRRQEIEDYMRSDPGELRFLNRGRNRERHEETQRMIEKRYGGNARAFYDSNEYRNNRSDFLKEKEYRRGEQELLAAQKDALGSMLASYNGAEPDGPLNFQKDEQELALLVRAAAEGKKLPTAPAVRAPSAAAPAVSAQEARARAPKPPTVAAPSGSRRTTVTPPTRATTPAVEAPISPVVQTTVINNTTVQSAAGDISRKIEGKLGTLPSRSDLLTSLQQLQNAVVSVAREQGITDKEIHGLSTELERLKTDVQNQQREPKDQEALHTNLRNFMKRFRKLEKDANEETPEEAAA